LNHDVVLAVGREVADVEECQERFTLRAELGDGQCSRGLRFEVLQTIVANDPRGGWHAQAMIGVGYLQASAYGDLDEAPAGIGIVLGGGHEWWANEQWSVGVLARIEYAQLGFDEGALSEEHSVLVPGLVASVTYH
jgi:hypothetical protein